MISWKIKSLLQEAFFVSGFRKILKNGGKTH